MKEKTYLLARESCLKNLYTCGYSSCSGVYTGIAVVENYTRVSVAAVEVLETDFKWTCS